VAKAMTYALLVFASAALVIMAITSREPARLLGALLLGLLLGMVLMSTINKQSPKGQLHEQKPSVLC